MQYQAVPRAEQLTREQMQPAAEQAAQRLDEGAKQLTQEVIQPGAQVVTSVYSCRRWAFAV